MLQRGKMAPLTILPGLEESPLPLRGWNFTKMELELAKVKSVVLAGEGCSATNRGHCLVGTDENDHGDRVLQRSSTNGLSLHGILDIGDTGEGAREPWPAARGIYGANVLEDEPGVWPSWALPGARGAMA